MHKFQRALCFPFIISLCQIKFDERYISYTVICTWYILYMKCTWYIPYNMHLILLFLIFINYQRCHVMHLPISFRVASLALGQSCDCPSANEATLKHMGKADWHQTTTENNKTGIMWYICLEASVVKSRKSCQWSNPEGYGSNWPAPNHSNTPTDMLCIHFLGCVVK